MPRWLGNRYWLGGILVLLAMVVFELRPLAQGNELIYLMGSKRIAFPELLRSDITWAHQSPATSVFDHLFAPLWYVFDFFTIAYLGRLVAWGLLTASLMQVCRAMRLPWWGLVVGVCLWLLLGQSLASGSWIVAGVEAKVFAYASLFFSLAFVLRGRMFVGGLASGLSVAFHPFVGGWGFVAVGGSVLIAFRHYTPRQMVEFLGPALTILVPVAWSSYVHYTAGASAEDIQTFDRLLVVFREPHHMHPWPIFRLANVMRVAVVFVASIVMLLVLEVSRTRTVLMAFVTLLHVVMGVGYVAGDLEWYSFLTTTPFRLGTVIPLLLFLLGVIPLLCVMWKAGSLNYALFAVVLAAFLWIADPRDVTHAATRRTRDFVLSWTTLMTNAVDRDTRRSAGEEKLYAWIRANTSVDSVFITPMMSTFWMGAERAQLVSFKHYPANARRGLEWYRRLQALNEDEPFRVFGFGAELAVRKRLETLTPETLRRIRRDYRARFYLTTRRRTDMAEALVFSDAGFWLYDLERWPGIFEKE